MKKGIECHTLQTARPYLMKEKNRGNPLSCPVTSFVYDLVEERRNVKKHAPGRNAGFRRPYLMRARQTKEIPCRKLSGGGIPELIQNIWVSDSNDQKAKTQT